MKVKALDADHRKVILTWLLSKGFKWHGEGDWNNVDKIEKVYPYQEYPFLGIKPAEFYIYGSGVINSRDKQISLMELKQIIEK